MSDDYPYFQRASGECRCVDCDKPYWKHPLDSRYVDRDGRLWLRRLCNGDLVKL